ncbi:MAG: AAA family ATPase [candidate division TM6 bacterium GW2011_GWE2_42_60]|nr:MAG: AAA family ATPase [candidate division TM6 bacterium GW2011_GWE2_42_60]HBY05656.1 AAA family ATPase [Candidatus Dependentiae bacterium]
MIIKRDLMPFLQDLAKQFPVVAIMGPRQSGKTTLAKMTFPEYVYVSLEDLDRRAIAQSDPRGFLNAYSQYKGVIIDEIQEVPELLSYMQGIVDKEYRPGYFVITGSQHFLMYEKVTQTLAGRIALLTLLPLSLNEFKQAGILPKTLEALLIKGAYPRLYAQDISVPVWCANYISTYIEKDVRQVLRVADIVAFQRFLKLCAARVGNILNYASLARDADISPNTAKAWISILEASYIIKLLQPYYVNFNKRVIKSPKIYFYDTALVCSLLGIRTEEELQMHPLKGALFESFVMSEFFKYNYNRSELPNIYFWRDVQGHEIDGIIELKFESVIPIEIKSGMTITKDFFKGLRDWNDITKQTDLAAYVVYGGTENLVRQQYRVFAWSDVPAMLDTIYQKNE